jgi:hypothetical protein
VERQGDAGGDDVNIGCSEGAYSVYQEDDKGMTMKKIYPSFPRSVKIGLPLIFVISMG